MTEPITNLEDAVRELGALPMPVGSKPQVESLPLKVVAELNDLRMRLAGMAYPPREVFLALYEGAEPELFTTVEAARECCDDLAKSDAGENYWDWTVNESGIHIQFWTHADDDRPLSETSGTVTPIVVQGDDDLSELERLRSRIAELEALTPAAIQTCRKCGAGYSYGEPCSTCLFQARMAAELGPEPTAPAAAVEDPCACPPTPRPHQVGCPLDEVPVSERPVDGLTVTFAPVASYREDPHDSPLWHPYRLGHDLPESGGRR